ncbi:MAG: hypothetical protein MJ246_00095 [Clostridia bacterium]|nr:hypothetical protein [Clostridia bacterium]
MKEDSKAKKSSRKSSTSKSKNYLSEGYNSNKKRAEKEKNLSKKRERDMKNYEANRNAYYEEEMTTEEIRKKRRLSRKRQRRKTNIFEKLVIVFVVVAIGVLVVQTCSQTQSVKKVEVFAESGSLEKKVTGKAKIVRDETVVYAPVGGDVEYYYHEGEKVKNGVSICKIYEKESSEELQEEIDALDVQLVKAQNKNLNGALQSELANVDEYIYGLIDEYLIYQNTNYSFDVYDLKSELESKFAIKRNLYLQNASTSSNKYLDERNTLNAALEYNAQYVQSPRGGIISYYIDNQEENYNPSIIPELKGKYLQEGSKKLVSGSKKPNIKAEEPICKIVDNSAWYITATLDKEETASWTINDVKNIRLKNVSDDTLVGKIVNVLEYNKHNIVTFKLSEQMSKYMAFRDIEIEIIEEEVSGIIIPNTAIESRDCVKLPKGCVINKNGNYFVIKSEGGAKKQQQVEIAYTGDEYYYILASDGTINKGEYVVVTKEETAEDGTVTTTEQTLIVGENVLLNGVYKVAGNIYKYSVVDVLTKGDEYTIIADSDTSNILLYDKVILDVAALKEDK